MASKRDRSLNETGPPEDNGKVDEPPDQMDFDKFVTQFRHKAQGQLWLRADKVTVADLARLRELEKESEQKREGKRPKELRVVWIDKKNESTT